MIEVDVPGWRTLQLRYLVLRARARLRPCYPRFARRGRHAAHRCWRWRDLRRQPARPLPARRTHRAAAHVHQESNFELALGRDPPPSPWVMTTEENSDKQSYWSRRESMRPHTFRGEDRGARIAGLGLVVLMALGQLPASWVWALSSLESLLSALFRLRGVVGFRARSGGTCWASSTWRLH